MVVESEGVLGLYNLAVRPDVRSRGLGAALVRAVQGLAVQAGVPLVLQSALNLQTWYEGLGFRPVGQVLAMVYSNQGPVI
jgi:predicted N-acetyltransferase YhbS